MLGINRTNSGRLRQLSREGVWVAFGQAMAVIGSLAGVRLLTELLNPTTYGELALGMTAATLANQVILGPLGSGVTRFYAPAAESGDLGSYMRGVRLLVFRGTGAVVLVLLLTVAGIVVAGREEWLVIAFGSFIFAIFSGYNSILNGIQNAARRRPVVALHQGMESWARFLFAALLIWLLGASSEVAMAGYAIAALFVLGSQGYFLKRLIYPFLGPKGGNEKNWRDRVWKYSWPMAATGVLSWGFFSSQRWALELFATTEEVGYFSAVFQIGFTPFSLAGGILMSLIMPIAFSRGGDGSDENRIKAVSNSVFKFCFIATLIIAITAAIGAKFHQYIFSILVAEEYHEASHFLPFAITSAGLFQISIFLSTSVLVSTKTRILLPVNTIGNLLVISINLILTYFYGIKGLFYSMVIGSFIHLSWNIYNSYKVRINV